MATIGSIGGAINISGLASGIDTSSIIAGLTQINNTRIQELTGQKTGFVQKQAVFSELRGKLLDLQDKAGRLARSVSGAFDAKTATSSDPDSVAAASIRARRRQGGGPVTSHDRTPREPGPRRVLEHRVRGHLLTYRQHAGESPATCFRGVRRSRYEHQARHADPQRRQRRGADCHD